MAKVESRELKVVVKHYTLELSEAEYEALYEAMSYAIEGIGPNGIGAMSALFDDLPFPPSEQGKCHESSVFPPNAAKCKQPDISF